MGRNLVALVAALLAIAGCTPAVRAEDPVAQPAVAEAADPAATLDFDAMVARYDYMADLAPGVPVRIDNPYGDVRLRFGGYVERMELHATAQEPGGAQPKFSYRHALRDGVYEVAPQLPAGTLLGPGQRVDLVAFVPKGHAVEVLTMRGLIESRGVQGNLKLRSEAGNINVRGTQGLLDAETAEGLIEVALENAPAGSSQRLATRTGNIIVALADSANATLDMATSAPFATEFSLAIERLPGQEPNKRASAQVGEPAARISIESKRGEIRLLRRAAFSEAASIRPILLGGAFEEGQSMKRSQAP